MAYVPEQQVYIVGGPGFAYDCFRFGAYFYLYNDGWWYRARRYGGPYRVIEARYVPRPIWLVPKARWRHHPHRMPPGLAKRGRELRGRLVGQVSARERGRSCRSRMRLRTSPCLCRLTSHRAVRVPWL